MRSSVRFLRQSASPLSPSSTSFLQVGQGNSMITGGVSLRLRPGCVPHTAQKERERQLEKAVSNIKVSLSPNKSKPGRGKEKLINAEREQNPEARCVLTHSESAHHDGCYTCKVLHRCNTSEWYRNIYKLLHWAKTMLLCQHFKCSFNVSLFN